MAKHYSAYKNMSFFDENGDVWKPNTSHNIVHAVIERHDGMIEEGPHTGRFFNGVVKEFNAATGDFSKVMIYDEIGIPGLKDANQKSRDLFAKIIEESDNLTLLNNQSQSPAAAEYLKTLMPQPKS